MKQTKTRQLSFFKVVALAMLLLLVPCKVRNFIEKSFDLEISKPNLQIKTTCKKECQIQVYQKQQWQIKKVLPVISGDEPADIFYTGFISIKEPGKKVTFLPQQKSGITVPYYVLFQQLKIHLV